MTTLKADFISEDLKLAISVLDIAQSTVKSDLGRLRTALNPDTGTIDSAVVVAGDRVVIEHLVPTLANQEVEFGFPISKLKAMTSDPANPKITLSNSDSGLRVKCGSNSAKIVLPNIDGCPSFLYNLECPFKLSSGAQLAAALRKVKASIYTDLAGVKQAARKIIDGVMFVGDGTTLKLYATDNNRLTKASLACSLDKSFVIPKEAVVATHQLLEAEDNTKVSIGLRYSDNSTIINGFRLVVGTSRLTSGVMAGNPPTTIDEFFKKELPNKIEIESAVLKKAVNRLIAFSEENSLFLSIAENGEIGLATANQSVGEATDKIAGSANVGPDRKIKINATYLIEALASSTNVLLENDGVAVRITHLDCPYNTQHVVAQMRQ